MRLAALALVALIASAGPGWCAEQDLVKKLAVCVSDQASSGNYFSSDGGKSAMAILQACPLEAGALLKNCYGQGTEHKQCNLLAVTTAQLALKASGH